MNESPLPLHERCFVMDAHCDTALRLADGASLQPVGAVPAGHVDLPRLRQGGVDVQVFALWIDHDRHVYDAPQRCLTLLDAVWREMELHGDDLYPVLTAADFSRAQAEGKVGVLLSIEDAAALGGSLAILRMFYRLGVRAVGLTWNGRNEVAEGIGAQQSGGGLTTFGRAVIAEMERLGMIVDVSHITERGFWDVVDASTRPFIASHSNARTLCDHPRNLTDEQMQALAERGGVMGMNFCPPFLREGGNASIEDVVRHIEYIVDVIGPEHVGVGSDYDGISTTPVGLEDVARLPALTDALLQRGYDEGTVAAIVGGNFRRVFSDVMA